VDERLRSELERYLDGGMSEAEASDLLGSLRGDPEGLGVLGRALEQQADLHDALHAARAPRARRPRAFRPSRQSSPMAWIGAAAAAAAALLLVVAAASSNRPARITPPPVAALEDDPPEPRPEAPLPARVERPVRTPAPPVGTSEPPAPPPPFVRPSASDRIPSPPNAPSVPRETLPAPRPALARLERVAGTVRIGGAPAAPGAGVPSGDVLEVGAPDGLATIAYDDGSRIEVRPGSVVRLEEAAGARVVVRGGAVSARVERQPPNRPMVFATPHVEVAVLGTRLALAVGSESSHVEVREGRVRMTRLTDRSWVDVKAGFQATALRGKDLSARPLPVEEILLLPQQAAIAGSDWRAVRDPDASTGVAIEAPRFHRQLLQSYGDAPRVTFTFRAEADREYHLWVRARTTAPRDVMEHDAFIVEIPGGALVEPPGPNRGLGGSPERALMNGLMHGPGYWWVGGDADGGGDATPVRVRFARAGLQVLRLYTYESPVRVDALWLSSTQKTRPAADRTGPR
jgi:ferric-dicitrate binding protein FerR (iron transport regulator)